MICKIDYSLGPSNAKVRKATAPALVPSIDTEFSLTPSNSKSDVNLSKKNSKKKSVPPLDPEFALPSMTSSKSETTQATQPKSPKMNPVPVVFEEKETVFVPKGMKNDK